MPYTADTDSHTLPLADAELPALLEDPELRGGYRYLTLFLDGPGWVEVDDVAMRFTAAQGQEDLDDYRGHFLSSDHLLNKIWYAGAYTVQINTDRPDTAKQWPYAAGEGDHADDVVPGADPDTDVIFDGGKRDRIVWQGDLAVQDPVAYVSTYDLPAVENSLSSLAGQQLDDGYMPAASQVGPHNAGELRVYGEYVTWFVSNMAEHYRWTGDLAYLQRWWSAMQRAVDWLEGQRDDTGLLSMAASGSCGHYGYRNCGHETYNNALYARILDQMAGLAADAGTPEARTTYADRAEAVRAAVNDQLWDEQVGAYRLSTEIPTAFPQDGNAAAVLAGIASPTQAKRAMRYLQRNNWTDIGALTVSQSTPNASLPPFHAPLPSWFEVDARLAAPGASVLEQQSAFELMHRFWGWMLRQDPGSTFWEHVLPGGDPNLAQFSSLAHGWAAGPTVSMTTKVLGVSPTEPGFRRFEVRPHPGSLSWAEGTVPTPHGDVRAAWQRTGRDFRLDASVPSGTVADLAVPAESQRVRVTLDGKVVWDGKSGPARPQDGYATVAGVGPGNHVLRVLPLDEPTTRGQRAAVAVLDGGRARGPAGLRRHRHRSSAEPDQGHHRGRHPRGMAGQRASDPGRPGQQRPAGQRELPLLRAGAGGRRQRHVCDRGAALRGGSVRRGPVDGSAQPHRDDLRLRERHAGMAGRHQRRLGRRRRQLRERPGPAVRR